MNPTCPKCKKELRCFEENHWGTKIFGLKCPDHDIYMDFTVRAKE